MNTAALAFYCLHEATRPFFYGDTCRMFDKNASKVLYFQRLRIPGEQRPRSRFKFQRSLERSRSSALAPADLPAAPTAQRARGPFPACTPLPRNNSVTSGPKEPSLSDSCQAWTLILIPAALPRARSCHSLLPRRLCCSPLPVLKPVVLHIPVTSAPSPSSIWRSQEGRN